LKWKAKKFFDTFDKSNHSNKKKVLFISLSNSKITNKKKK